MTLHITKYTKDGAIKLLAVLHHKTVPLLQFTLICLISFLKQGKGTDRMNDKNSTFTHRLPTEMTQYFIVVLEPEEN